MNRIGNITFKIEKGEIDKFKKGTYYVDERYNVDTIKLVEKIGSVYYHQQDIILSTQEVAAVINMWLNINSDDVQLLFIILGITKDISSLPLKTKDSEEPNTSNHDIVDVIGLILNYQSLDHLVKLACLNITIYGVKQMEEAKEMIVAQKPAPFSEVKDTPKSIN